MDRVARSAQATSNPSVAVASAVTGPRPAPNASSPMIQPATAPAAANPEKRPIPARSIAHRTAVVGVHQAWKWWTGECPAPIANEARSAAVM